MSAREPMTDRSRLLRLLMLLQSHAALMRTPDQEALQRAGFVRDPQLDDVPEDRFLGRRILAWVEEREQRRRSRRTSQQSEKP